MPPTTPPRKQKRTLLYIALFFFLAGSLLLYSLYMEGYRLTRTLSVARAGTITITVPEPRALVMLDGKIHARSQNTWDTIVIENVDLGPHTITVTKDNFHTWIKTAEILSADTIAFESVLAPRDLTRYTGSIDAMTAALDAETVFATNPLPLPPSPLLSPDRSMEIWTAGKAVEGRWLERADRLPAFFCAEGALCEKTATIASLPTEPRSVSFWSSRSIIVSAGTEVSVTEFDRTGGRNTFTLYRGAAPEHRSVDTGNGTRRIYIQDAGTISAFDISYR